MATLRSILSRWILAAAVFCGSLTSLGAAFAPLSPSCPGPLDIMRLAPSVESRIVSGPMEAKSSSHRNASLSHLGELIFTHHAISISA